MINWRDLFKKLTIFFFATSIIFGIASRKNYKELEEYKKKDD